jgi:hypothetical protein
MGFCNINHNTRLSLPILNTMKKLKRILLILLSLFQWNIHSQSPSLDAQQLLFKLKTGENCEAELMRLANINSDSLATHLNTENLRKAFWINVYNAFIILKIRENPILFKNKRGQFFKKRRIKITNQFLSFDDIEHGILRRSKNKLSRGYFNKTFVRTSKFERQFRLQKLDYRLHFALNCGAVSCPPVTFYDAGKLDEQLNLAQLNFLTTDSNYEVETNTLMVSKIFFWFIKDFGGKIGVIQLHKSEKILPENAKPKLKFKDYDWTTIY